MPTLLRLTDASATRSGQLTLSNVINDASRALGVQGDGLQNDGSTGAWKSAKNWISNGGFETTTTGWVGANGAIISGSTAFSKFGAASLKIDCDGSNAYSSADFTVTAPGTGVWVLSGWAYCTVTVPHVNLRQYNATDGNAFGSEFSLTAGTWVRFSVTRTVTAAENILCSFYPSFGVSGEARTIYIDGIQLEPDILTPYVETDGATATRAVGLIYAPAQGIVSARQGWVAARIEPGALPASTYPHMWWWGNSVGDNLEMFYGTTEQAVYVGKAQGASQPLLFTSQAKVLSVGTAATVIAAWDAAGISISADGAAYTSGAETTVLTIPETTMQFLGDGNPGQPFNGNCRWLVVGTGPKPSPTAINNFGNTKPTIRALDNVARGAHAMAVWDGRTGTFQRRIGA